MKVFISSVISGFESYRDAAADAITSLGYEVICAENMGAVASSPQGACLAGVRQADLTVLMLGERYGIRQPSGLSATHEEYREARSHHPVLAFVQEDVHREPDQLEFVQEVREWESGTLTVSFTTRDELRRAVTQGLHNHMVSSASGSVDEQELLALSAAGVEVPRGFIRFGSKPEVTASLAAGPRRGVVRPGELESSSLAETLHKEARFGAGSLFAVEAASSTDLVGDWLVLSQERVSIKLSGAGDIVVRQAAVPAGVSALIEEDVRAHLTDALRFAAAILDHIDPVRRLTHIAITAALTDVSERTWRTREEHARSRNSGGREVNADHSVVHLNPGVRARAEISQRSDDLALDLMVLLCRKLNQ